MSGRVQKDSADDSDRVDDAVDPRVQVSARCRRRPRVSPGRNHGRGGSPLATRNIDTLVVRDLAAIKSCGKNHVVRRTRATIFTASLSVQRQFSFSFASVSYFFPSLRLLAHAHTHARIINVPDS